MILYQNVPVTAELFRIPSIIDEFTRECLAILVARKIKAQDVIDLLFHLFIFRGIPRNISVLIMAQSLRPKLSEAGSIN